MGEKMRKRMKLHSGDDEEVFGEDAKQIWYFERKDSK